MGDLVTEKFKNLQQLCLKIDKNNEWIVQLQNYDANQFVLAIRPKMDMSNDQIYQTIITESKIGEELLKQIYDEDKTYSDQLMRYIVFFRHIIGILYQNNL